MSTTTPPTRHLQADPRGEAFWPSFLRFWGSTGLGLTLIFAIAAASVLGTVVPQGDPTALDGVQLREFTKHVLLAIDATNVYYSGWFLTLLALFFLNLSVSTVRTVWPRLRVALKRPPEVPLAAQASHPVRLFVATGDLSKVAIALRSKGYRLYIGQSGGLVGHKGRWSRLAPMVSHLGLFILLLGGIFSGLASFKAQVPLLPGESKPMRQVIGDLATRRGPLASADHDWSVRVDRFWMDYYTNDTVKQFYSELSIVKGGHVVAHKRIWVNEPLNYDGVWFYQAFWGLGALDVALGGKSQRIELRNGAPMGIKGSFSNPIPIGSARYILYLESERKPLVLMKLAAEGQGQPTPVGELAAGQAVTLDGVPLAYKAPVLYSGLQTKSDPGIPAMYTGFFVVFVGTALAFFSLRQVWVNPLEGGFLLSGRSNRGSDGLLGELSAIAAEFPRTHAPIAPLATEGVPS